MCLGLVHERSRGDEATDITTRWSIKRTRVIALGCDALRTCGWNGDAGSVAYMKAAA